MEYSSREDLIMPEYGRNIQQMVEHALTIQDKEKRTRCAHTIVASMGNLFTYLRDVDDFKHKLWDHLAIMSDFKLDIDYPHDICKKENLQIPPERIPYEKSKIKYMHYGRSVQQMIEKIAEMPDSEEKNQAIVLVANQMKKCFVTWCKDTVDDNKIFKDLQEMSNGRINISEDMIKLANTINLFIPRNNNNGNNNKKNNNNNNGNGKKRNWEKANFNKPH